MKKQEIIERVAAGLRKMTKRPDALLFLQHHAIGYIWDEEKICGVSVYHGELLTSHRVDSMCCEAIFMPIFTKETKGNFHEAWAFCKGFDEV
jgi:hypothetical protein